MLTDFFKLKERSSTVRTEIIAGATTFVTISYILAVNPAILSAAGMPAGSVFSATAIVSVIATLIMGVWANLPVVLSAGMGLNAFFAYTVCLTMGYPYQLALTAVFCEGIVFLLLSLFNVREAIVQATPPFLKSAIAAGIGLFIAFIGLQSGGIVTDSSATLVKIGSFKEPQTALTLAGLVLCVFLHLKRVKGAFLICILCVTLAGISLGITNLPHDFSPVSLPSKPLFFDFMWDKVFTFDFFIVFFTFFFMDIFDTVGTLIAVADQSKLINRDGSIVNARQAFIADAVGTATGAVLGTSTVTSYAESLAGVAAGGRTGLTALTAAALFALALFFSPVFLLIPSFATAPVLIMVGFLMASSLKNIDFSDCSQGLPAFMILLIMPMTYSIAEGIVFGILSYVLCAVVQKQTKMVPPLIWGLTVVFLLWLFIR